MDMKKTCGRCKEDKKYSEFGKSNQTLGGLRWECYSCRRKTYYLNHEKELQQKKNDYEKHKEERLLKSKKYYKNNSEDIKRVNNNYYHSNKEKISETNKLYRERNKETIAKRKQGYQQRKKQERLDWLKNNLITVEYPPEYKICTCCHTLKLINLDNFNLLKGKKYQDKILYRAFCKICESEKNRKFKQENSEVLNAKSREKTKNKTEEQKKVEREKGRIWRQSEEYKIQQSLPENRLKSLNLPHIPPDFSF